MHPMRRRGRVVLRWLGCLLIAALLCLPWAAERAIERARFDDRLGTLPVRIGLAHNGYTTLDTGLLGKVYWNRTAPGGFGALMRSTGPPLADGTLASYVSPAFVRANTEFLDDPEGVAAVYGSELRRQVITSTVKVALVGGVLGGTLLAVGWSLIGHWTPRKRTGVVAVVVVAGATASVLVGVLQFRSWDGNEPIGDAYPLPGRSDLSFSSPQTREIAQQVQPFIEKNTTRILDRAERYQAAALTSSRHEVQERADALQPRDGEVIVLAEADPQGSLVGTHVRRGLYAALAEVLPDDVIALRTIAGDVTSNGTVAEAGFVEGEAAATPAVPVVAVKGDHDTDVTVDQLLDAGVTVAEEEIIEDRGLRVAGVGDPTFKALFGGMVINNTGVTPAEIGAGLREETESEYEDDPSGIQVLLHQPRAVVGYLGVGLDEIAGVGGSLTTPVDDGIPDLPPGTVTYGHLHDADGPWVIWNTDTDELTWTVVTQLGTAGGVEENPTINRFSTPFSAPLKTLSTHLHYVDAESGLQTGMVPITFATDGTATIGDRIDLGLQ